MAIVKTFCRGESSRLSVSIMLIVGTVFLFLSLLQTDHMIAYGDDNSTATGTAETTISAIVPSNTTNATESIVTTAETPSNTTISSAAEPTTTSLANTTTAAATTEIIPSREANFSSTSMPLITTEEPSSYTTVNPGCTERTGFDGASFVGGIVLGLSLCVIGFLIYKCYMNKHAGQPYNQF